MVGSQRHKAVLLASVDIGGGLCRDSCYPSGLHWYWLHLPNQRGGIGKSGQPINGITTNTTANASLRVPYLGFEPGGLSDAYYVGDSKFNSLQATVRKQLSHGFQVQAAYTYSRSFSTVPLSPTELPPS